MVMKIYFLLIAILTINVNLKCLHEWEVYDINSGLCFPWYAKPFLLEMQTWDMSNWKIFEWRSRKHSTIWLAKNCRSITAVDDLDLRINNDLHQQQMKYLIRKYDVKNLTYKSRAIEVVIEEHPFFGKIESNIRSNYGENSPYVNAIHETDEQYDCIIIDGWHYNACARAALSHVKKGTVIIVDNCHRLTIGIDSTKIFKLYHEFEHKFFYDPETVDKRTDVWIVLD